MNKVFENPHAVIFDISDEIPATVFAYWKGYLLHTSQEAKDARQASLDYFAEKNIKVMISDHQYLEGASVEFLQWLHDYYFPTAVSNGLISEIVLDSQHFMGSVSLDLMYNPDDLHKNIEEGSLYTPKADTLENAKRIAAELVNDTPVA